MLQDKSAIKEIRSFFVFDWLENKRKDIYNNIESSHIKFSGKWTKTNIFWSSIMFLIEAMLLLFLVEQTRIGNIDVGQVILILQSNVLFVSSDEAKEIARLQRELRDTKDALEVLKKAIGILGK